MGFIQKMAEKQKNDKKDHEDFVRRQNEWCFLAEKQEVKYHGTIITEIFHLEDFKNLKKGLDKIYTNLHRGEKRILKYNQLIRDSPNRLFQNNRQFLPVIKHSKLKGKTLPTGVFFDLGKDIEYITLKLDKVSPSMIILQFQVYLNENLSSEINKIIYTYHNEKKEFRKDGSYVTKLPGHIKEREISKIRKKIKIDAAIFLSLFFKGYFLSRPIIEIIPSMDLFSFRSHWKKEELKEWGLKYQGFFNCFNTNFLSGARYEEYFLLIEQKVDSYYNNGIIFGNEAKCNVEGYEEVDIAIKNKIGYSSFAPFTILRWLEIQQRMIGKFNNTVSLELEKLKRHSLKNILSNRKDNAKCMFRFERFKTEFEKDWIIRNPFPFKNIQDNTLFFNNLTETIVNSSQKIGEHLLMYKEHSREILDMINIEYNKKTQNKILLLTFLMFVFMLIQIWLMIPTK